MSFTVLIPARFQASRLPGKPMREIQGVPLVVRVLERARASGASRVVVASDAQEVVDTVRGHGGEAVLTDSACPSGTDRLAQAAAMLDLDDETPVVNCQGDEPFVAPSLLREVAEALGREPQRRMATAAHPLQDSERIWDPHAVKVVVAGNGDALYFSRAPIPWDRERMDPAAQAHGELAPPVSFRIHIGLYAYRAGFLRTFSRWPVTDLERREGLEQLRAVENGVAVRVIDSEEPPGVGVDTPDDLERANRLWAGGGAWLDPH